MQKTIYLILILFITSCAGIKKIIILKADTENWEKKEPFVYSTKYLYHIDSNSICIATTDAELAVSIGPAPIPIFHMYLFYWTKLFWKNEPDKLKVDMFFDINEPYSINFDAIKFVNINKNLLPYKIESIIKDNNNKTISIDYNLTDNSQFKSEEPAHFRWYFEKEVKKIKQMDIYIDSLIINNTIMVLPPLTLKRKKYYEYNPLMVGHF